MRDPGPLFAAVETFGVVRVHAALDIAVSKVTAILGREAARDYIDLYFLLRSGLDFDELLEMARQRDLGLSEFYLAYALKAVERVSPVDAPKMIAPLDLDEVKRFFVALAESLMRKVNPAP